MNSEPDYWYRTCEVEGHFNATTLSDVRGGRISFSHNGVSKVIIPAGFEKFKCCLEPEDVDVENDEFQLQLLADDGVYDSVSGKEYKTKAQNLCFDWRLSNLFQDIV